MDDAYARGDRGARAAERPPREPPILLVAYFYPPCRDTGALRAGGDGEVAAPPRPRVTVLTTSAYGAGPSDAERGRRPDRRRPALARAAARARTAIDALFDSDTYSGRPHPLSKRARPRAAGRRLGAVRALGARCALAARAAIRLRDHDLAAGVGARGRPRAARAAACPGSPTSATPGPSSRCARAFPTALPAPPRRAARAPLARRRRRRRLRLRPAADDLRARGIADPLLVPNGWDPELRRRTPGGGDRPARPRADLARLHRPLRQLRPRPAPAGRGARASSPRDGPGRGGEARAGDRRAADRRRGGGCSRRRLAGPDRPRSAASMRARRRWRCSARPTPCC